MERIFLLKQHRDFLRLLNSARYQIFLFRKAVIKYFRSVFFIFKRKTAKIQNKWSIENLSKLSLATDQYFKDLYNNLNLKIRQSKNAVATYLATQPEKTKQQLN